MPGRIQERGLFRSVTVLGCPFFLSKSIFYCALKHYWLLLMPDALGCCEVNRDQGAPGRFTWYLLGMSGPSVVADTSFLMSPLTHSLDGAHSSTQAPVLQPDMPCPVPEWLISLCPSPGTVGAGKAHSRTQGLALMFVHFLWCLTEMPGTPRGLKNHLTLKG